jgi:hypothetical protein
MELAKEKILTFGLHSGLLSGILRDHAVWRESQRNLSDPHLPS